MHTLPNLGHIDCIEIAGADARRFAQAQFSGDVRKLATRHWQWNAWLTPAGRVRALVLLAAIDDERLLLVPRGGNAKSLCADLTRYLFRSHSQLRTIAFTARADNARPMGGVDGGDDGVVLGMGERSLQLDRAGNAQPDAAAQATWRLADIEAGWPTLTPHTESLFLPPALGLEHLGAVAFDKGCFPGQEIATRVHHRDACKYRLFHVRRRGPMAPDRAGRDFSGQGPWVVCSVAQDDTSDALVVAPKMTASKLKVLGNIYNVVSMFHA